MNSYRTIKEGRDKEAVKEDQMELPKDFAKQPTTSECWACGSFVRGLLACLGSTITGVREHVKMRFWFGFFRYYLMTLWVVEIFFYIEKYTNFLVILFLQQLRGLLSP